MLAQLFFTPTDVNSFEMKSSPARAAIYNNPSSVQQGPARWRKNVQIADDHFTLMFFVSTQNWTDAQGSEK